MRPCARALVKIWQHCDKKQNADGLWKQTGHTGALSSYIRTKHEVLAVLLLLLLLIVTTYMTTLQILFETGNLPRVMRRASCGLNFAQPAFMWHARAVTTFIDS